MTDTPTTTLDYTARATEEEIKQARREHGSCEIEIDPGAKASRGDDGLWVQAWVWIDTCTD